MVGPGQETAPAKQRADLQVPQPDEAGSQSIGPDSTTQLSAQSVDLASPRSSTLKVVVNPWLQHQLDAFQCGVQVKSYWLSHTTVFADSIFLSYLTFHTELRCGCAIQPNFHHLASYHSRTLHWARGVGRSGVCGSRAREPAVGRL